MCGILGIISGDTNNVSLNLYEGLTYLQHRGQDSCGISNEKICIKKEGLVKNSFVESDLEKLKSNIAVGHVRYSTTGTFSNDNIQPLEKNINGTNFFLCHNGNITNIDFIQDIINKYDTISDTQYLFNLIEYKIKNNIDIIDVCKFIINEIKGSYSILLLIEGYGIVSFRDKNGIRPLIYGINKNDYIISSESNVINVLDYRIIRDVNPGEIIEFKKNDMPRFYRTSISNLNPCLFEYIYFSRNDSIINNISVYNARYQLGRLLGNQIKKNNINDIDVIVPVPDTGTIFGLGLSHETGIQMHMGFVKNNYIDRTFIMKDNEIINKNIKRKINVVNGIFCKKNILIVDDSIVRGNTSKFIISLAKNAGAKKIYLASGSPRIEYPNNYGIYIPNRESLIANNRSNEDIANVVGCNLIIYNDLFETINCLKEMNKKISGFEISMFNNNHL
tara:strand:- start:3008 stop:4348 length:1341 start_codon:yes stop_codon:yes gene_type:complete